MDKRTAKARERIERFDPFFFNPRWISKYLAESIRQTGDVSLAFDLMLKDKWCFAKMDLPLELPCNKCAVTSECYSITFKGFLEMVK